MFGTVNASASLWFYGADAAAVAAGAEPAWRRWLEERIAAVR